MSELELRQCIKAPDFPTGAVHLRGRGPQVRLRPPAGARIKIRGVVEVEEGKRRKGTLRPWSSSQIPYALNKSSLVEKIAALVNDRKIEGVSDLRDESDRKGIRIVLDLKKGAIPDIDGQSPCTSSRPLETSFGFNMLAVVGNRPQLHELEARS